MPFKTGLVYTLDCGKFGENLERALTMADCAGFARRREQARERDRLRGIGFANIIEQTWQAQGETVMVRLDPGGTVTVIPGSISHGQGHETMYKILLSHRLGLDEADIRVAHSDTDLAPGGCGTYASCTAVLGGSAATMAADKVIAKAKKIAAHALEAAEDDIEFADATFRVAGTDRAVSLQEVAAAAYVPSRLPPGLETGLYDVASFSPEIPNFPNGCHLCEIEIDPETDVTRVPRYIVVDGCRDFGGKSVGGKRVALSDILKLLFEIALRGAQPDDPHRPRLRSAFLISLPRRACRFPTTSS